MNFLKSKTLLSVGMLVLTFMVDPSLGLAEQPGSGASASSNAALPDSPSTSQSQSNVSQPSPSASSPAQTNATSQTGTPQQPSGTAVAPSITTTGNAASRPAGAAIAPPKQRQVRSFLIKFGFIAGAGAALGTVAALSLASPSRVPGSH